MRQTVFFIALVASIYSCHTRVGDPISQQEFTRIYRDSLVKLYPAASYTINQDLQITGQYNGREIAHFLVNAYNEYTGSPSSLKSIVSRYSRSSSATYRSNPVDPNKIMPVIMNAEYADSLKRYIEENNGESSELQPVYAAYNEKLVILFAEDYGDSISYITREKIMELNMAADTLQTIAIKNLAKAIQPLKTSRDNGVNTIAAGGRYETSLILLNNVWSTRSMQALGKIIIAIPAKGLLFVTGDHDPDTVDRIREKASEAWENGTNKLVPDLFTWTGTKFEVLK